jgi:electron transfer flavoprotein alpha subunit
VRWSACSASWGWCSQMVLIFAERSDDELFRQAITFARTLEDNELHAVGIDDRDGYAPAAWGAALAEVTRDLAPSAVVAPGTDRGNEVLAHVAAQLDLPMAANCTSVTVGDPLTVTRVRWGGSLLEEARLHGAPALLTAAPHAVAADPVELGREVELIEPEPEAAGVPVAGVSEHAQAVTAGVSLSDADVVVSGGRGVGSAEGFVVIEELAELLGAAVGCSRAVTSAGWRPHTDQVGQTGTKISPSLYIACGISGATQHMAGCKGAKKLLAINPDREASIFANADYAVFGDLHEVLPAVSAEIRKTRGG